MKGGVVMVKVVLLAGPLMLLQLLLLSSLPQYADAASSSVGCQAGFYNLSVPNADPHEPVTWKCFPKHCSTVGEKRHTCPGPAISQDGSVVCGQEVGFNQQQQHQPEDTSQLRKDIYKSIRDDFLNNQKQTAMVAAEQEAGATQGIYPIPQLDSSATQAQINASPFKWNLWPKNPNDNNNDKVRQCDLKTDGSAKDPHPNNALFNGCSNAYTQYTLVHDPDLCWPPEQGIPIIANGYTTAAQMRQCYDVTMHMLSAKPNGSYVMNPYEQRDAFLSSSPVITCGNNQKGGKPSLQNIGYPQLLKDEEGGGGTYSSPWTYAESNGMCKYKKEDADPIELKDTFKMPADINDEHSGTRYGGTVQVEEFGHTIFDVAISFLDPQGWRAVQQAAKEGRYRSARTPDPDWDCFTSATEYFAAGVELVLHNTRIGTNLKARNRTDLWHGPRQDKALYCLVARYYEVNNLWKPCASGPLHANEFPLDFSMAECRSILENQLGVTKFGKHGSGEKADEIRASPKGSGTVAELRALGVKTCPEVHITMKEQQGSSSSSLASSSSAVAASPPALSSSYASSASSSASVAMSTIASAIAAITTTTTTNATLTLTSSDSTTTTITWNDYKTGSVVFAAILLAMWYVVSSWTTRRKTGRSGSSINSAKLQLGRAKFTSGNMLL